MRVRGQGQWSERGLLPPSSRPHTVPPSQTHWLPLEFPSQVHLREPEKSAKKPAVFPSERALTRCMGLLLPNRCHNLRAINLAHAKTSTSARPLCPLRGAPAATHLNSSSSHPHTSRWSPWPWTWVTMTCPGPGSLHVLSSLIIFIYPLPSSSGHCHPELYNLRAFTPQRSTRSFYISYHPNLQVSKLGAKEAAWLTQGHTISLPFFLLRPVWIIIFKTSHDGSRKHAFLF